MSGARAAGTWFDAAFQSPLVPFHFAGVLALTGAIAAVLFTGQAQPGLVWSPGYAVVVLLATGCSYAAAAWLHSRGRERLARLVSTAWFLAAASLLALAAGGLTSMFVLAMPIPAFWIARFETGRVVGLALAATGLCVAALAVASWRHVDAEDPAQAALMLVLTSVATITRLRLLTTVRTQARHLEQANRELSSLVTRLDDAREEDRNALMRRIHDGVMQNLVAALLHLSMVAAAAGDERRPAIAGLRKAELLVRDSLHALRRVMQGLEPLAIEHMVLGDALRARGQQLAELYGVDVDLHVAADSLPMTEELGRLTYRLLVEAMTNAARHAGADRVVVHAMSEGSSFRASVTDDGSGLALAGTWRDSAPDADGMGLRLMWQQVQARGGSIELESTPGTGTTVRISLPTGDDGGCPQAAGGPPAPASSGTA